MTSTSHPRPPPAAQDALKRSRLRFAQALAFGLLLGAGGLYILARALMSHYPWLRYVAAFSQAAMVGALADWFAVVALFRHPFGIKLPHTAIISSNKTRIANNLGEFIQSRFLSTEKVLDGIQAFGAGRRLAKWMAQPGSVERIQNALRSVAAQALHTLDQAPVRAFIRDAVSDQLIALDASTLASRIIYLLSEKQRHQWLLDEALTQFHSFLQHEDVREELVRAIAKHMEFVPSTLHLDERLGRAILQRLYDALQTVLQAVHDDHEHVLRRRFDEAITDIGAKLIHDPQFRARVQTLQAELVRHPETIKTLEYLWETVRDWLSAQIERPEGLLADRLTLVANRLVESFLARPDLQAQVDEQLMRYAPALIARYRRTLGLFITAQVKAWNDEFMVDQIELNIGRDLQFIRVNGTLVGGLVGLLIYVATQFIG